MNRILSLTTVFLVAMPMFANGRPCRQAGPMFIATTGRIIKIDTEARTILVRGSEGSVRTLQSAEQHSWQHTGVKTGIILPGGIKIGLPGKTNVPPPKSTSGIPSLDQYTVVTTNDTLFRDGGDSLQFE